MTKKEALIEITHDHTLLLCVRFYLSKLLLATSFFAAFLLLLLLLFLLCENENFGPWRWSHSTFNTISITLNFDNIPACLSCNDKWYTHASLPFLCLNLIKKTKFFFRCPQSTLFGMLSTLSSSYTSSAFSCIHFCGCVCVCAIYKWTM